MLRRCLGLPVALALAACGGEPDAAEAARPIVPPPTLAELEPEPGAPEPIFGPDGELLESSETFAGVTLPRGLETLVEEESRHVARTATSVERLAAYFGPRLATAEVTRSERGVVTYLGARPTGVTSGRRMDVTLSPTSGLSSSRLEIRLEPEVALGEPSEEDVRRRLESLLTSGE